MSSDLGVRGTDRARQPAGRTSPSGASESCFILEQSSALVWQGMYVTCMYLCGFGGGCVVGLVRRWTLRSNPGSYRGNQRTSTHGRTHLLLDGDDAELDADQEAQRACCFVLYNVYICIGRWLRECAFLCVVVIRANDPDTSPPPHDQRRRTMRPRQAGK